MLKSKKQLSELKKSYEISVSQDETFYTTIVLPICNRFKKFYNERNSLWNETNSKKKHIITLPIGFIPQVHTDLLPDKSRFYTLEAMYVEFLKYKKIHRDNMDNNKPKEYFPYEKPITDMISLYWELTLVNNLIEAGYQAHIIKWDNYWPGWDIVAMKDDKIYLIETKTVCKDTDRDWNLFERDPFLKKDKLDIVLPFLESINKSSKYEVIFAYQYEGLFMPDGLKNPFTLEDGWINHSIHTMILDKNFIYKKSPIHYSVYRLHDYCTPYKIVSSSNNKNNKKDHNFEILKSSTGGYITDEIPRWLNNRYYPIPSYKDDMEEYFPN